MRVLAGIAAAGASSRAGLDKLTAPIAGTPSDTLLSRALEATAGLDRLVALPPHGAPYHAGRVAAVGDAPFVEVPGAGMSASLRALARGALTEGYDALLLHLADMPLVTAQHIQALTQTFAAFHGTHIVRAATASARAGHPIIFPASVLPDFERLTADIGARSLLARRRVKSVVIDGEAALADVDTREALAALRPRG